MPLKNHYDAVIVGGGHNGLIAAAYLAGAGQSVLLLERNTDLGGATASKAIFPGLDARLSRYSYLVSLLPEAIVRELGIQFSTRGRAIASCTPYVKDGRQEALLLSNVDEERSQASLAELTDETDRSGYRRLLQLERVLAAKVWPSLMQPLRSRSSWAASMRAPADKEAWDAFVERPLGETVEGLIRNDVLRGLVFTDAKIGLLTHPHDPSLLQNRCFILHVIGRGTGEWQVPVGGMGALVEDLTRVARRNGAELVTQAPVDRVELGEKRHSVEFHRQDQDLTVEATRVLLNAGPQVFARLLGQAYVPAGGDEGSVCKVNMVLRRLPRLRATGIDPAEAFGGTFHIDESYVQMKNSYDRVCAGDIPERLPAEVYCHTLTDDSILGSDLRSRGYHTLTLFGLDMPYTLFASGRAEKDEILKRYFDGLNAVLADPIEECLAVDEAGNPCVEIKSPVDLECEIALNLGNIFHAAPSWFFTDEEETAGTWGVETEYERVYRCGSSALRGGAVSGIPGRNAAMRIFEELRIPAPADR